VKRQTEQDCKPLILGSGYNSR